MCLMSEGMLTGLSNFLGLTAHSCPVGFLLKMTLWRGKLNNMRILLKTTEIRLKKDQ